MLSLVRCIFIFSFLAHTLFAITEEEARNFTYFIASLDAKIKLVDGVYHVDGAHVLVDKVFLANLNPDTVKDAFVILKVFTRDTLCEFTVLLSSAAEPIQTHNIILPCIKDSSARARFRCVPPGPNRGYYSIYLYYGYESLYFLLKGAELSLSEYEPVNVVKKPAIYLYPLQEERIRVRLQINGFITQATPSYEGEWEVKVSPDGMIEGGYKYLFYEAAIAEKFSLDEEEGWVVSYDSLSAWFDQYLPALGLKGREVEDFKEYWLRGLDNRYRFYEIRLLDKEFVDHNLQVSIDPKPEVFIRVFLHFRGTNHPGLLKQPALSVPVRGRYTAVEWGGIVASAKDPLSFLPSDTGKLVIRELILREHKLSIRVNTNGCTDKSKIEVRVRRPAGLGDLADFPPCYEVSFFRVQPDYCRAFLPDGVVLEYDIKKELGIETKIPYFISVQNPIYPFTSNEPFFQLNILNFRSEEPRPVDSRSVILSKALLQATIEAIQMEIQRYRSTAHPDRKNKLRELHEQLKFYQGMQPSDYQLEGEADTLKPYGPLMPPLIKEIEVLLQEPQQVGTLLQVKNSSKSGPFYHVAGWSDDLNTHLEPGLYKAKLYLVYKREYFAHIPDYYVFIEWMKK